MGTADKTTMSMLPQTGPWGLSSLEKHIGQAGNLGEKFKRIYEGGKVAIFQEYGPFSFPCGCRAKRSGSGGDWILHPCTSRHAALTPEV
jgi:hypothetical protein